MKFNSRAPQLVAFSLSLLPFAGANAGDTDLIEDDKTAVQEQVYVTATRSKQRDLNIAAAVTAVAQEQVGERRPDVIAGVLRATPGTWFQQTTPGQGVPIIRGLKGSQVLHMVDGMRLNNALFRNAPNQYVALIDAFSMQRVEVVRGAQGALYGADAMGGVMQVLTPEPAYSGAAWQQESQLYSSFDSVDTGWAVSTRTAAGKAGWGFTGGASYQHHSSRKSGRGERLQPSDYRSRAADFKLLVKHGKNTSLMLSAQVMEQPSTPRYDELTAGFGQARPAAKQFRFKPSRRSFVHARLRLLGAANWFDQLEVHAARQIITDNRLTQAYDSPVIVNERNRSTLDGVTVQFNSAMVSGARWVWGAEYYTDAITSQRVEKIENSGISQAVRSRFPNGSSMDSSALYIARQWQATRQLALNAGLRYSWFEIKLPASDAGGTVRLTPADFTGDLHAIYALNPAFKLVANVGRGFRPPNVFDLATLGPRPGNRFNIANPGLSPENVRSYDLGIKLETERVELELFVFYLDYANKITSVLTGAMTTDGRDIVRSENRNKVNIHGLEAGLYWSLNNHLRSFIVLNYTRGEERHPSKPSFPADRIPPVNGKFGLEFRIAGDWKLEPYVLFAGSQPRLSPRDINDPRINPAGSPGWASLNLLLDWQLSHRLQLGLRLENLTDRSYREHASGIDAPGRNIGLWLNYRFP